MFLAILTLVSIKMLILDLTHASKWQGSTCRGVAGVRPRLEKPRPRLENISKNTEGVAFWPPQLTNAIRQLRPDDRYFNFTLLFGELCISAIYIIKGVMFVCLSVSNLCSVWPAKRLGRSRPNLTHALMSTQGVFLARSMSRSFMYACGSDRSTKHP